jgi:parvulin-like peptidyl-prolyl isomerase
MPPEPLPELGSASLERLAHHGLLRAWLERELVASVVASEPIDAAILQQLMEQFCKRHNINGAELLGQWLSEQGLSLPDLHWQLGLPLRVRAHSLQAYGPKAELRFLERKSELDQVVYSLLRVREAGLARELYLRIQHGEASFADLAARYAEGPEQATHGIVGPVPLTQAHPALAERLRTHEVGALIPPFPLEQWWLVVRPERYLPACFDEAMQEQMCRELFEQWVQEEVALKLRRIGSTPAASSAP